MLDIISLLQPVSPERPTGIDLREANHPGYIALKDARVAARQQERDALYNEDAENDQQHWRKILDTGPKILMEDSKDLSVASWLTEALTRVYGFEGLEQGLQLLSGLIKDYWEEIYPHEDEDGLQTKVAPLVGLNGEHGDGTLIAPINSIPLTSENTIPIANWQYQQALQYSKINDPDKIAKLVKNGAITLDSIKEAVLSTPAAHFTELETKIQNCLNYLNELRDMLDQLCGHDAPPTSDIQNTLRSCLETVQIFGRMVQPSTPKSTVEYNGDKAPIATPKAVAAGQVTTKEEAFDSLLEIAHFFRENEPHSPVSYLLEQAIRLGNLTLPELLAEIIPDEQSLHYSLRMLGAQLPYANEGEGYTSEAIE